MAKPAKRSQKPWVSEWVGWLTHASPTLQEKFQHLSPSSTEYNVVRTYLDWLTTLPWDTLTKDNLDMHHAESTCRTPPRYCMVTPFASSKWMTTTVALLSQRCSRTSTTA